MSLLLNSQNNSLNLAPQLRMCIVELKAVSNVKSIYKIVLYLVMLMAKKVLAEAPTKYKIFWLDEAWKLLDDPYFGDFIKYLYKTIRKEDSGIGLIVPGCARHYTLGTPRGDHQQFRHHVLPLARRQGV